LQGIPAEINTQQLEQSLVHQLPLVRSIHDLHVWTMDGEYNVLSFHLVIVDHVSMDEIARLKKQVRVILKQHHVQHATIEIEYEHELCELTHC
jgi:cobalt-zinc-cadmium efflux system protein